CDLHHRVTLELIAEIGLPHRRLLFSKLGLKASRNLGAIQVYLSDPRKTDPKKLKTILRQPIRSA
ncbi:hypothetical protein U1701_18060, partial [Sphingomonas sp. PB2P19]|uniref:hypothetical protein n=1 Tax=Sphingomonas rhamnosi TaxID=3096156 RepID=UPI002FC93F06